MERPSDVTALTALLRGGGYLADRGLATALHVSLSLGRPLLLEGEVGVGKTEVAKALASVSGRRLIRLQCYEGIDTSQALYDWDYARQMLQIRALSERDLGDEADEAVDRLFGPKFLIERPLLDAVRAGDDGRPPHRRGRSRRRRVRGFPSRAAVGLPGQHPRDRYRRRRDAAGRDPHLQPDA